jgi:hypothetical protein
MLLNSVDIIFDLMAYYANDFTWLNQTKHAKMQWIQDPNQGTVDNLNNVTREPSKHFRNKKKEYLKAKINELETNSKDNNIRDLYSGINDFKESYQPISNTVNDDKGCELQTTPLPKFWTTWRNNLSQLLKVHGVNGVNDVRQTEIQDSTSAWAFQLEIAIEKLKKTQIRYYQNFSRTD